MNDTLMYFLKVNIAIALFYLFYRLFFAGDTFWKTRRFYLLFSIALSFVYPYFSLEQWLQKQEPVQQLIINAVMLPEYVVQPSGTPTTNYFSLENIIISIYALVVITLTARMIIQFLSIARFRMMGKPEKIHNVRIINVKKGITPFSFFGNIYINASLHKEDELEQILAHELTHVRQLHSFDVLVSEMLCNVFWFNPATWLLKREIRQNLEFLADNNVLESGFDSKTYQYHLLQLAYQTPELEIANKFNVSPLKKRITMMNQQKTNKARLLKYSLIVPLALALVVSSNAQEIVEKAKKSINEAAESFTAKENTIYQRQSMPISGSSEITTNDSLNSKDASKKAKQEVIYGKDTTIAIEQTNPLIKQSIKTTTVIKSDEVDGSVSEMFAKVDIMPQFPGGEKALMEFISKNIKYPQSARENGIQGTTIIQFIIDKTGKVTRPSVGRSLDSITDAEAIRVIKLMPKWIPGENNGKKVNVLYTLPIRFKLDDGDQGNISTRNSVTFSAPTLNKKEPIRSIIKFSAPALNQKTANNQTIYTKVDKMPEFIGGEKELMMFLSKNVRYPSEARQNGIQGTVVVRFIVNKLGKVEQAEIMKSTADNISNKLVVNARKNVNSNDSVQIQKRVSYDFSLLEKEALRVVNSLPNWTPGEKNGKKVSVYYSLPIKFRLSE